MAKAKTLEDAKDIVVLLDTRDQVSLKEFIEQTLETKVQKASEELSLIKNSGK